MNLTSYKMHEY